MTRKFLQPSFDSLDTYDDKWYHKLDAKIYMQGIILLGVK